MRIARSTHFHEPKDSADDTVLVETMHAIKDEFGAFGWCRMQAALGDRGWIVNHKKIRRLMREHALHPLRRRRFVATTDSDHEKPVFPDRSRNCAIGGPYQLWVADLTCIAIPGGFAYLAAIIDVWSHRIVGLPRSAGGSTHGLPTPTTWAERWPPFCRAQPVRPCLRATTPNGDPGNLPPGCEKHRLHDPAEPRPHHDARYGPLTRLLRALGRCAGQSAATPIIGPGDRDTKPSLATPLAFAALEEAYAAIAEAFDAVGPDRETLFLVTLALVLARASGDIERLGSGIESARRDRNTGTGRVRRRDTGNGPGCRARMPGQDTGP